MSTVYEIITEKIVGQLERGVAPWRKPWGGQFRMPRNLTSRKEYRGVNVFLLSLSGYESPFWLTYKQAQQLGGHVRKGEKSMPVVFWTKFKTTDKQTGEALELPVLRFYSAFNVAQCELPANKVPTVDGGAPRAFSPIEACRQIVDGMPSCPPIQHGFGQASYSPIIDVVRMPKPESFDDAAAYYATLFHELTHSTGHASRLSRKSILEPAAYGSDPYGREELVAEMGAAFLCGHAGIDALTLDNSAAYVAGWLSVIRQDAKLVVTAAAQAQKAADFILGRTWGEVPAEGGTSADDAADLAATE